MCGDTASSFAIVLRVFAGGLCKKKVIVVVVVFLVAFRLKPAQKHQNGPLGDVGGLRP